MFVKLYASRYKDKSFIYSKSSDCTISTAYHFFIQKYIVHSLRERERERPKVFWWLHIIPQSLCTLIYLTTLQTDGHPGSLQFFNLLSIAKVTSLHTDPLNVGFNYRNGITGLKVDPFNFDRYYFDKLPAQMSYLFTLPPRAFESVFVPTASSSLAIINMEYSTAVFIYISLNTLSSESVSSYINKNCAR